MANPTHPHRVQLRRTKGWRMPENTVKVCRPGKYGNPFKAGADCSQFIAVFRYREWLLGDLEIEGRTPPTIEEIRRELGGKNLACFCDLSERCHADVLLEIANSGEGK